jgi:hypothetical protein
MLKKRATKSNSPADRSHWLQFKVKRNAINQLVKKTPKICYFKNELKNNSGNSKGTWKVLNDLMARKAKSTEINKINISPSESSSDYKKAKVTLIFKRGDRCESNNYRPISVISAIARIFEKLVYIQLENYVHKHNLINPKQCFQLQQQC